MGDGREKLKISANLIDKILLSIFALFLSPAFAEFFIILFGTMGFGVGYDYFTALAALSFLTIFLTMIVIDGISK